jgi:hypothetical protein
VRILRASSVQYLLQAGATGGVDGHLSSELGRSNGGAGMPDSGRVWHGGGRAEDVGVAYGLTPAPLSPAAVDGAAPVDGPAAAPTCEVCACSMLQYVGPGSVVVGAVPLSQLPVPCNCRV